MPISDEAGRLPALALLRPVPSSAPAADVTLRDIVVHQPWSRAMPGGAQVSGHLEVENRCMTPDLLVSGSFAASTGFEPHAMTTNGGVIRMRPANLREMPPSKSVRLEPSGLYVMFAGLKRVLRKGETVPGTLTFDHAGIAEVDSAVRGIADSEPGQAVDATSCGGAPTEHPMPGMNPD